MACQSDAQCVRGTLCQERSVCVGSVVCAGLLPPDADLSTYERATVEDECGNAGSCSEDSRCETIRLCVPSPDESDDDGGGCAVRPAHRAEGAHGSVLALSLLATALGLRRTR
jgi:hypothetical protein